MVKVLGLSKPIWCVLFALLNIATIIFMILAMVHDYWFHQDWKIDGLSGKYKGYLLGPKTGLSDICDDDGDSYSKCYDNCKDDYDIYFTGKSSCDRFEAWKNASISYVAFTVIAIVFNAVSMVILCIDMCNKNCLKSVFNIFTPGLCMIPIFICHLLAFAIWAGTVELNNDDCSHDFSYKGTKSVCGEGGVSFAIFILIWLFCITPVYVFISRKVKIAERDEQGGQGLIR